jgi:hypothetical protein
MQSHRWFEDAFGLAEAGYDATRARFRVERSPVDATRCTLRDVVSGRAHPVGSFEVLSSGELRERLRLRRMARTPGDTRALGALTLTHLTSDVRRLLLDPENAGAVFQVASQFNALEMTGPEVRPEDGITRYVWDRTQGPVCSMCCPAATLFRNYFCMPGGAGQGASDGGQLDLLAGVEEVLGAGWWRTKNGYAMPTRRGAMREVGQRLDADAELAERVRRAVRVAVHWDATVTDGSDTAPHQVCQVFTSAMPIAYTADTTTVAEWRSVACVALDGLYDATLAAAALLAERRGRRVRVFLTAVGGGAFGTPLEWVAEAAQRALDAYAGAPLDVVFVHYRYLSPDSKLLSLKASL